jgi:hypothetical protein
MFLFKTNVNCFHYIYDDADFLRKMANESSDFDRIRFSRSSLILYIVSLEALINRVFDEFLPEPQRTFFIDKEEKFSIEDKFYILPLILLEDEKRTIDKGSYPWSHFIELIKIRNEFLHPKHKRIAYYQPKPKGVMEPLNYREIPKASNIKENEIVYRQTRLPRDPYGIKPENIDQVKKIVDDIVSELNKLMGGKLDNAWLHGDKMELFYPPGAQLSDIQY